jgi:hypothetical protein
MAKQRPTNKKHKKQKVQEYFTVKFLSRTIRFTLDNVLLLGFVRKVHGRFWGLAAVLLMNLGLAICFLIRPDMLTISTAFSDFGSDVRTAPYFAASMFFSAYGLWRWRNYLNRTLKRSRPFTGLVGLTIVGLYLVAFMPVSWEPWPYRVHMFGVILAGSSMAATVVVDGLLSQTKHTHFTYMWRVLRYLAAALIVVGGFITFGSAKVIDWFQVSLLGEYMILGGYTIWICVKTYQGEGPRTKLSKLLKNIVVLD